MITNHPTKRSVMNEALERKKQILMEYDKTISETEAAYNKIMESSQALLHVLRREAKNLDKKSCDHWKQWWICWNMNSVTSIFKAREVLDESNRRHSNIHCLRFYCDKELKNPFAFYDSWPWSSNSCWWDVWLTVHNCISYFLLYTCWPASKVLGSYLVS